MSKTNEDGSKTFFYLCNDCFDEVKKNPPVKKQTNSSQNSVVPVQTNGMITNPDLEVVGKCYTCGKTIYKKDKYCYSEAKEKVTVDGKLQEVTVKHYYCQECERKSAEENKAKDKKKTKNVRENKTLLIVSLVIGIIFVIGTLIGTILNKMDIGWIIGIPLIGGYIVIADIFCLFNETYISDVFLEVAGWSIHFPGIIFTFDLDGLMFLIGMKILFGIIGFLVGIGVFLLALAIATVLSIFSFPFYIIFKK